jgi:hypothetical protein
MWQVAAILLAIGTLIADAHFRDFIAQGDYSFRGIDLIIWGFIGCFGFGVGALILAKGCLVLFYTIQRESGYPKLTAPQWLHVIISRLNSNSVKVGALIWVATFGPTVANIATDPAMAYIVVFTNFGIIALIIDAASFQRRLQGNIADRRNLELGIGMLVAGIFGCMDYGLGVLLLLKGVAVIVLSNIREPPAMVSTPLVKVAKPEVGEVTAEVEEPANVPVPQEMPTLETAPVPEEIPAPTTVLMPISPVPRGAAPAPASPPVPRPGPAGKPTPLFPQARPPVSIPAPVPQPPAGESFEGRAAIREYLNRVYTVLSSKVRDRVMKLDIPETEKKEVLDGLLYLMPDEQEQFIAELEELARKLVPEIVGRVMRLNLTKEQNEMLLRQLEDLSDQEQVEFVEDLERVSFGAA